MAVLMLATAVYAAETPPAIVCNQEEWFFGLSGNDWEFTIIDASYSSNLVAVGGKSTTTNAAALLLVRDMESYAIKVNVILSSISISSHTATAFDIQDLQLSPIDDLIVIPKLMDNSSELLVFMINYADGVTPTKTVALTNTGIADYMPDPVFLAKDTRADSLHIGWQSED